MLQLPVLRIIGGTSVDGPGLRTSIYIAGCRHNCPECHNPESWSFDGGVLMSIDEIMLHVKNEGFDVTLTGGDPLFHVDELLPLLVKLKEAGYNVWCYTGYTYEQVVSDKYLSRVLDYVDVLVDGRFEIDKRDISLQFRGSVNQRLIDVRRSTISHIVLYDTVFNV